MKSQLFGVGLFFSALLLLTSAVIWRQDPAEAFLETRAELVVRQIGHKLLQHAGDSTSRVLPVIQLSQGVFQLEFESPFAFMPDSLVKIAERNLTLIDLPVGYNLSVLDCISHQLVYGFEISPAHQEIVPCLGRVQPKGCYSLRISFMGYHSSHSLITRYAPLLFTLASLSMLAFIGTQYFKIRKKENPIMLADSVSIGSYFFSLKNQLLQFKSEIIELSEKEAKVLSLLANHQNQLISREELLKRVWEDEGVFTGRSLDMFISKLRKKLKNDLQVQITNVHGKGYKLETKP